MSMIGFDSMTDFLNHFQFDKHCQTETFVEVFN